MLFKKMLTTNLSGGLGNCIFIYLTSKILAKENNLEFFYFQIGGGFKHFTIKNFFIIMYKKIRNLLNLNKISKKQIIKGRFHTYFILEESFYKLFFFQLVWSFKSLFENITYLEINNKINKIELNQNVSCYTRLPDFELYDKYRAEILEWLKINKKTKKELIKLLGNIKYKATNICSMHIRRGDYLRQTKGYEYKDQGWELPIEYYKFIIDNYLPKNIFYIIVTDDKEYVKKKFNFIPKKFISSANNEVLDLLLFSSAKYNIVANSTFSMFGAWFNKNQDKVIYAPKYNIGWKKKEWYPKNIEYKKFNYIDINEIKL